MHLFEILKRPFNFWFPSIVPKGTQGLSTFSGVYLPSVLQMLGVILFIRLGWITGHVGIAYMSLIIFMSSSILFITTLSLISIVTNMKVGNGGSYYIISRSLGMEFGSAIGILLSLAQLTTVAICISGFAISVQEVFPDYSLTFIEICTLGSLFLISLLPVDFAVKAQGFIFFIVIGAVLSIFVGGSTHIPDTIIPLLKTETFAFWTAFALFFPAATGIESGMAMSGDLKTPSRSIAIGCMAAVLTAYLIYVSLSFFLSFQVPHALLRSYPMIIYYVSKYRLLFIIGVWGATLSSAIGGLLTAPRTLQALAKDKILPRFLAKGHGKTNHPIAANLLIIGIVTLMILFTDINHLLPVLSMICLITYALLNFVASFESLIQNPSWRPLFKTHWSLSLAGTVACLIAMFMINAGTSFIVIFLGGTLCFWTTKRKLKSNWDDIRYSIFSFFASTATNKLVHIKKNPRSWRPNILAIIDPHLTDTSLIQLAHSLNQSKGFLTFGTTLSEQQLKTETMEVIKTSFEEYFRKKDIPCFFHINSDQTSTLGTHHIVKNYGLGPLQPNTLILTPPHNPDKVLSFCELLYASFELQKNILLFRTKLQKFNPNKQIDLWWSGHYHTNFELILALAHIMQSSKDWFKTPIVIKTTVKNKAAHLHMTKLFEKYNQILRFKNLSFKPYLDENPDFYAHLTDYSSNTALTFLGLRAPSFKEPLESYATYFIKMMNKTRNIPTTAYVLAGEKLNFQKIFK